MGDERSQNKIQLDIRMVQEYGLEEAVLLGALLDSSFMKCRGQLSGLSQSTGFDYPWDIRTIGGRTWVGFLDTDLRVLLPFWDVQHSRKLLESLAEQGVLDTQEGSKGTHYSIKEDTFGERPKS